MCFDILSINLWNFLKIVGIGNHHQTYARVARAQNRQNQVKSVERRIKKQLFLRRFYILSSSRTSYRFLSVLELGKLRIQNRAILSIFETFHMTILT